jgi:Fur family ferric uptake transcriptional regulator
MRRLSRKTQQKELLQEEITKFNSFFTAEDLFKQVRKKDSNLGIATVYRFLKSLVNKGELYSYLCDRRTLYSKQKNSHCHYICERTGKIIHFELENLDFLKKIKDKIPGSISSFQIEIKGVCDKCSK